MSTAPLLFNPSRASSEELEATLVARRPLLEKLEEDLIADSKKRTKRHWQLIGPRGSGKSHFTELIARRLSRDHGWAVARLPEEQYQVGNLGELLEQIVIRLEQLKDSPLEDVKDFHALEELALDRIRAWREKHKKPILVILENLGSLFERKLRDRRSQSRLREILTRDPPFVLLATATSYVDATVQHSAPFYDFFQVITLEDLSSDEVTDLIEARAQWDMDELLLTRIDTVRARAHAVFHFSGGNPRLVLTLYSILRRGFTDELFTQILKLLDEVTPYYQQRLNDISPQMGRILAEMALSGQALAPSDIAKRCRMQVNHVTANIAKLVSERFVRPTGRPSKRKRSYDLNDRLFRLWMQMREDQAARQRLRFLSEFFQHWYEGHPDEVRAAASRVTAAFWQDLRSDATQRCREHIATLEYLQDALPEHSEFLMARLSDHRPNGSPEAAADQVRRLRLLLRSEDRVLRAVASLSLASDLEYLKLPEEGLRVLRDADSAELPHKLRFRVLATLLFTLARTHGPQKAISEGLRIIEQEPATRWLLSVLAQLAAIAHDSSAMKRFAKDDLEHTHCKHCASAAIRNLVRTIADSQQLDMLGWIIDLFTEHAGASELEIDALKLLSSPAPDVSTAERFLRALAYWDRPSDIPAWLLWSATCAISHTPGQAPKAFPLIQDLAKRGFELGRHSAYHLLLILLDAIPEGSPSFTTVLDWTIEHAPRNLLAATFVECVPVVARARTSAPSAIFRVYTALLKKCVLPRDLLPYSIAVEVREAPEKMASLSPEVREAVSLLVDAGEQEGRDQ
ncbi:MAG TPA: ATP-binding protein [Kofleriaceae bacterium]|nr:ATP-binding protein [Kofleriaceae bacterium]